MKQLSQDLRSGVVEVAEVPAPRPATGQVLIQSRASLISSGSERTLVEFGQASLLAKARSEPERMRQVLDKIRTDGLLPTLEVVFARLDQAMPLGYCNAGIVLEVGASVRGFETGDRVASNGHHAELVVVPQNLCVRIPDRVDDASAAFTVLGAVALEGQRLLAPTLGESVAVIGLGLVGLLAVQLLHANGCRVLGIDPDPARRGLAQRFGADVCGGTGDEAVRAGLAFSRGRGLDAVLITASAPEASLIRQAAGMSRKRGRVVLTGVVDMEIDRREFYERELSFQVSCSYGPGRYEQDYEEKGIDYPLPYVRWTAQRNFEAFLDLVGAGRIAVEPLIGRRATMTEAPGIYADLKGATPGGAPGIILTYGEGKIARAPGIVLGPPAAAKASAPRGRARVGVVGSGQFARLILLPALRKTSAELVTIASRRALAARDLGKKFGFRRAASEAAAVIEDPEVDTVFILTRHDSHAALAAAALAAGKHVFVEKPLAIRPEQLAALEEARRAHPAPHLLVGFNRGFAPLTARMVRLLSSRRGPASVVATVNAGELPRDHWILDPEVGGGRILGEACHWVDLMVLLVGSTARWVTATSSGGQGGAAGDPSVTLTLAFADGSIGTLHYLTAGHRGFPKERVEVFYDGRVLSLDNFKRLRCHGADLGGGMRLWRQDKGHGAEVASFLAAVEHGGPAPIPFERLVHVTQIGFAAVAAIRSGARTAVPGGR